MKEIILLLIVSGLSYNINGQNVNYEDFKGEKISVVMDFPLQKVTFRWYNKSDLSDKAKSRIKTIADNDNMEYASSSRALLNKIYHAKSKKDLEKHVTDKKLLKRFKVKKTKDYTNNHFISEYQVYIKNGDQGIVILKYTEIEDGKEVGKYTLQAIRDRGWKVTELEEWKDLEFIVGALNAASFQAIYQQYKGKDEDINQLRERVRTPMPDNRLNLTKLAQVLKEVQKSDPQLWKKLTE
ncbi:MAG: hypothetical protein AAF806_22845 [Bacteroidota bacterium]